MKKLIHTDNYESFYLDYLEGTLSAEERMAFEEFLTEHPELQVDEELIFLDDAPEKMDPLEKSLLKKEEIQIVSAENLDYLAIGKVEHVLSAKEEELFDTYAAKNPEAQKLVAAYRETRLEAAPVVYPNKEDLKEKEVAFISWRLIAGVASAAALVLLFFQLGFNNSGETRDHHNTFAQKHQPGQKKKSNGNQAPEVTPSTNPVEENNTFVAQKHNPETHAAPNSNHNSSKDKTEIKKEFKKEEIIIPVQPENNNKALLGDNTPQHQPTILPEMKDNKQPVAPTFNEEVNKAPSKDLASNAGSNMKNPIPVITHTISEKTKTPVDFQTGKATETQKGGFFVKIGKFEISHKASKKK